MSDNVFRSKEFKDNLAKYEAAREKGDSIYLEPDELTDIAEYYHLHGRLDEALQAIDLALQMFPGAVEPLTFRARYAILVEQDADKAKRYANMIEDKHDLDYYYIVAEILIADGYIDDAEAYLEDKKSVVDEDDMEDYCLDVATLFADYDVFDMAEEWLDECEDEQEDDYIELRGRIALNKGDFKASIEIFNGLIDRDPYQSSYWNELASAQYMASQFDKSLESSEYALAINADDADAIVNKANCLMMIGNGEEALKYYKRYKELQPRSEVGDMGIASIMMTNNDLDGALKHWLTAEQLCPTRSLNRFDIYRNICLTYAALGKYDEAFSYVDKLEKLLPGKANDIYVLRGYILLLAGQEEKADEQFHIALANSSQEEKDGTLFFVAYCYFDCNYMKEANVLFRRLTKSKHCKDFTDLWAYLVRSDYELGLQEAFLEDLKTATVKNPHGIERELSDLFPSGMQIADFYNYAKRHPFNKRNEPTA